VVLLEVPGHHQMCVCALQHTEDIMRTHAPPNLRYTAIMKLDTGMRQVDVQRRPLAPSKPEIHLPETSDHNKPNTDPPPLQNNAAFPPHPLRRSDFIMTIDSPKPLTVEMVDAAINDY